jgi:hypothetical protein
MTLSRHQADALAERFDDLAFEIACAFHITSPEAAQSVCARLEEVYQSLRREVPRPSNESHLMCQLVASLQAAVELCHPQLDAPEARAASRTLSM